MTTHELERKWEKYTLPKKFRSGRSSRDYSFIRHIFFSKQNEYTNSSNNVKSAVDSPITGKRSIRYEASFSFFTFFTKRNWSLFLHMRTSTLDEEGIKKKEGIDRRLNIVHGSHSCRLSWMPQIDFDYFYMYVHTNDKTHTYKTRTIVIKLVYLTDGS